MGEELHDGCDIGDILFFVFYDETVALFYFHVILFLL